MPDRLKAAIKRAASLRRESKFTEALAILLDLYKAHPRDPQVNYELACTYDPQGMEEEAIPHYEFALENGLGGEDLRGALLGLGSSYRCTGRITDSVRTLEKGIARFPDAPEFKVFLALSLYNLGRHRDSMTLLLAHIAEYSREPATKRYGAAIAHYAASPDLPDNAPYDD
ncbi:MAG TPA: tetratricopeptide repeat protein [Usitatibacteraceae bacterium]